MKIGTRQNSAALIFVLLSKSSGAFFSVLLTYIVMNYYSNDAAEFFLIFSAVNITSYICRFGSDNYLLRANPESSVFASELTALYASSVLASVFVGAAVTLMSNDKTLAVIFFIVNIFFTLSQINSRYYAVHMNGAMSAFVMNAASLAVLVVFAGVDMLYLKVDISYSILWGWCLALMIVSLLSFPIRCLTFFDRSNVISVIDGSRLFFISGILNLIIYWGGQVVSGFSLTEDELKALAFSQRISGVMGLLSLASSIYMSPRVARFYQSGDKEKLSGIVKQCNMFVVGAATFSLLIAFVFYEQVLELFNVDSAYAWLFLFTICCQSVFCMLSNSLQLLNMTNNEYFTRRSVLYGFVVFVTLSVLAYIFKSIFVMAVAVNLSLVVQGGIAAYYVKRRLTLSPLWFVSK